MSANNTPTGSAAAAPNTAKPGTPANPAGPPIPPTLTGAASSAPPAGTQNTGGSNNVSPVNPPPTHAGSPVTPAQAAALPKDQPASGVKPAESSAPAPATVPHPASPGGVQPPSPVNPNEPNPQAQSNPDAAQAKNPEEQRMGNMPLSGTPSTGTDHPTGLTPDKNVKQRQAEANAEFLRDTQNWEQEKKAFTMLYPVQDQKIHNPVTAHGDAQVNMDGGRKPKIEVRIEGHNKKALAEVEQGKWSAHFDILPTGTFGFELWVNDKYHSTVKAEILA